MTHCRVIYPAQRRRSKLPLSPQRESFQSLPAAAAAVSPLGSSWPFLGAVSCVYFLLLLPSPPLSVNEKRQINNNSQRRSRLTNATGKSQIATLLMSCAATTTTTATTKGKKAKGQKNGRRKRGMKRIVMEGLCAVTFQN